MFAAVFVSRSRALWQLFHRRPVFAVVVSLLGGRLWKCRGVVWYLCRGTAAQLLLFLGCVENLRSVDRRAVAIEVGVEDARVRLLDVRTACELVRVRVLGRTRNQAGHVDQGARDDSNTRTKVMNNTRLADRDYMF